MTILSKPVLQQLGPRILQFHAEGGAEAVTKDENYPVTASAVGAAAVAAGGWGETQDQSNAQ